MSEPPSSRRFLLPRTRLTLIGSAAYLTLIFAVMLWRGISIEPEWVVLALLLIAIAMGRGRTLLREVRVGEHELHGTEVHAP